MNDSLKRILNSQIKVKRYTGRITKRVSNKFAVNTAVGTVLVEYNPDYKVGNNVEVTNQLITGKAGVTTKTKPVMV